MKYKKCEKEFNPLAESLAVAWRKYTEFFGQIPHGTTQQFAAMIELMPNKRYLDLPKLMEESLARGRREAFEEAFHKWCHERDLVKLDNWLAAKAKEAGMKRKKSIKVGDRVIAAGYAVARHVTAVDGKYCYVTGIGWGEKKNVTLATKAKEAGK